MTYKLIKIGVSFLALILVVILFAGCNGQKGSSSQVNSNSEASSNLPATQSPEPLELPIVTQPLTLTYWVPVSSSVVKTNNDIAFYQQKEKDTGIHIDFQHPPKGQESEQFNLMIASHIFPDIVERGILNYSGGPEKAIDDGLAIKLNDLIDKYAPNLRKIIEGNPEVRKQIITDSGILYCFPMLRLEPKLRMYAGFQIRQDWLDKLGLKEPSTVDEWYTVLKAFHEQDPNSNGDPKDEIPFGATGFSGWTALTQWTCTWGINYDFYQENGKIKYGPIDPVFKDFLSTMAKWYQEGLIDPDFAATDSKSFDAKVTTNKIGAYYGLSSGQLRKYNELMAKQDPNFRLRGVEYPVLKAGDKPTTFAISNLFNGNGAVITSSCKYQKEAVKWLDYNYSERGHLAAAFGIEGVSYKMENGYPKYTDVILKNPDGLAPSDALSKYGLINGPIQQDVRYFEQMMDTEYQKEAIDKWASVPGDKILPPITPTFDESKKLSSIMADIDTYKNEMVSKMIMGEEPISSFDKFVQSMKSMGIDEAISIEQAALDRYNKR